MKVPKLGNQFELHKFWKFDFTVRDFGRQLLIVGRCCRGRGRIQNDLIPGLCSKVVLDCCPDDNRRGMGLPPMWFLSNFHM